MNPTGDRIKKKKEKKEKKSKKYDQNITISDPRHLLDALPEDVEHTTSSHQAPRPRPTTPAPPGLEDHGPGIFNYEDSAAVDVYGSLAAGIGPIGYWDETFTTNFGAELGSFGYAVTK